MKRTACMLAAAGWLLIAAPASADEIAIAAAADLIAGVEGGGSGYAAGVRRTRTSLRLGADVWVDEYANNILGVAALIEIEPVATFGADVRYQRRVANDFVFHLGGTAVIAPKHMIGGTFGVAYRIDVTEILEVNAGPMANVYFVGADLPGSQVIWQVTLGAGARVRF